MEELRLRPEQLTNLCDQSCFDFETTEELTPIRGIIGQNRAQKALEFGLAVKKHGYNIYVAGNWGSGRNGFVKMLAEEEAIKKEAPHDYLYVNNFKNYHSPIALKIRSGEGKGFIKAVERSISFLKKEVGTVFTSRDYENAKAVMMNEYNAQSQEIINQLNDIGRSYGFIFSQSEKGLVSIPLKEGKPMNEEEYRGISDEEYEQLKQNSNRLSLETVDLFNLLRHEEENYRNKVKNLDEQMGRRVVSFHLLNIRERYKENEDIKKYLDFLVDDIVEHIDHFKTNEEEEQPQNPLMMFNPKNKEAFFDRYRINLFVDNSELATAPVVFESNPTYQNLLGSIEYRNEMGVMKTDFTMIKPGALHAANGGYLILLAKDLLTYPYAWKSLKRSLLDESITIEARPTSGAFVSSTIKPQPIPLTTKVIIIGDAYTYSLLYQYDEEFRKLFKIKADFDSTINRSHENIEKFARYIATKCERDHLKHFSKTAVAKLIEYGTRLADDQKKLSAHLRTIGDVITESDYWATYYGETLVTEDHVKKALLDRDYRANRYEEVVLEMFADGTYLIDVDGDKVGEINGLAVTGSGQYQFGKPSKITVSTYKGRAGIVNIEREARTSGSLHDKGVMILTGFLGHKFAQDKPLALTASIVFEQLYSGVDGDSASSTELYAILSSLSGIPIKQGIAVTGSVNQRGYVQPIGGVNEKIEGFYKVCKMKGLTGEQGVMIPHQNIKNLMLDEEIIQAVKDGQFHIYAVETIDQGIQVLTGKEAGERNKRGNFPRGTLYYLVDKRLKQLAQPIMKRQADSKKPEVAEKKGEEPVAEKKDKK